MYNSVEHNGIAGADLYLCQTCCDARRFEPVTLDRHLRCGVCGSEQVVSLARMEAARRITELEVRG